MNCGEGPYQVRVMPLTQDDIWSLADGTPWFTVVEESEAFFVIGRLVRDSTNGKETFLPNQCPDGSGKFTALERREDYALEIAAHLNEMLFASTRPRMESLLDDALPGRELLMRAAFHYFAPGLDAAFSQVKRDGYSVTVRALLETAPRYETWYQGGSVACLNQGTMVLLAHPQTQTIPQKNKSSLPPPVFSFSFRTLAMLAFPDPRQTQREQQEAMS